ncbi:SAM-dependent methyltransferase [Mycoplasma sp. CSL7491-lung]|uniref:HsdM family class I SAM-dependent methyltransferase n=1 Tax=Mycoplasma sp. CSL7491-lung TaxID=549718 RepID=UPI001C123E6C|nr:N-6 DNA methylase [Mycoplasma sp. CSL7491-lung]MBU4692801.1 SAM-dependent methyltransferase [Mycoplasma sp. CSL7491-lung]
MSKVKELGKVYTPPHIVDLILNQAKYNNSKILKKHIIDNSCGDGAFLIEIVKRYCLEYYKKFKSYNGIEQELETYIHGIEIDLSERNKCIGRLNKVINNLGIENIKWDIINDNTLNVEKYNNKMDYVIGNPPYVRIHNLKNNYEAIKKMNFSKNGMTDLFIVFYELGMNMLNDKGILSYITPSSIINSKAGSEFRKYIVNNQMFESFINLKHNQPFKSITTYTGIFTLNKNHKQNKVDYYEYINNDIILISTLDSKNFYINDNFYFGTKKDIGKLNKILTYDLKNDNYDILVKNGLATLSDKIFIKDSFGFKSKHIIPVFKGSINKEKEIIYPYDEKGNILDFNQLESNIQNYFLENKIELEKRSIDKNSPWYAFGRSQGIKDIHKDKITINSLLKTSKDIKLNIAKKGVGVYSGLYILGDIKINDLKKILNDDFVKYITLLNKYKSGGYYTFSSSDIKRYIIYSLNNKGELYE